MQSVDIDECRADHPVCDRTTSTGCTNTDGDYRCHCKRGFLLSTNGHFCEGKQMSFVFLCLL